MDDSPWFGWLHRVDGGTLAIPERGLVLGRRDDCDAVLASPEASQVHALLTPTLDGLELFAVGRNPTLVDGTPIRGRRILPDGCRLELPGGSYRVEVCKGRTWSDRAWCIEHPDGQRYALRRLPFRIGGGRGDHLVVEGWPDGAVAFLAAGGAVAAELRVDARLNGVEAPAGTVELIEAWDRFEVAGKVVSVRAGGAESRDTTVLLAHLGPKEVRFRFEPTGARLELRYADEDGVLTAELPELRARLVATLLQPPGNYQAGDAVPDDRLIPSIWSARAERGRTDLNVLIYRLRKDLMRAGINPARLVERARNGGSTRVLLAPGAVVRVD